MDDRIDLSVAVPPGRHVSPDCPDARGPVWLRPVNSSTVSFTYENQDAARLYYVNLDDGACWLVHTFERPSQTANVWKNCEAISQDGSLYTLVRYAPDRYVVTDVAHQRERMGERLVIEAPVEQPGAVQFHGAFAVDGRLVIGHGERGLTLHDLRGRTGLEPSRPSDDERTGFEPTL